MADNVLRPEACLVEYAFCHAQCPFFIFNRNQRMVGEGVAERLISTLIRTGEISPRIREALKRGGNNAEADQA